MAKPAAAGWISLQNKRLLFLLLLVFSGSTALVLFIRGGLDSCDPRREGGRVAPAASDRVQLQPPAGRVFSAKGQEAIDTALKADLVVLNTAVAGKWLDPVLKEHVSQVLPKILWWIHEMRGHYFKLEYVKHLPFVAGAMIDSYTTAEYWKNRTHDRLKYNSSLSTSLRRIQMPQTYVVHLGNSRELMEVAEDNIARRVLREHIRESLGVWSDDLLFAIINSVSRGKGQDLFLHSFYESLQLIQEQKLQVPSMHVVVVGSDMNAQTKFETELRDFVSKKGIQDHVHFVNKTLTVAPYLAAIDVLVQNSQYGSLELVSLLLFYSFFPKYFVVASRIWAYKVTFTAY
ncbi:putative Glycosyl transferase [Cocos nucifera]|uniref:Putative Glycosyl transferase n=1 Tax=Cocos nucifera TaxID=13894 RepID=A0A8K0IAR6_COCNU|nr:putative Glycosyl transferase [Cocos nucifera]